jgi:hypothetical protein
MDAVTIRIGPLVFDHAEEHLERKLQDPGVNTDSVELKALPRKVELSDRLRRKLKPSLP